MIDMKEDDSHVFDIETLALTADAVILSVGMVPFHLENQNTFEELVEKGVHVVIDIPPQKKMGRKIDQAQVTWWEEQDKAAAAVFENEKSYHPLQVPEQIKDKLGSYKKLRSRKVYTRGNHFDIAIFDDFSNDFDLPKLWEFYTVRDIRTFFDFFPDYPKYHMMPPEEGQIKHNALHDCARDAYHMQQCWKQNILTE